MDPLVAIPRCLCLISAKLRFTPLDLEGPEGGEEGPDGRRASPLCFTSTTSDNIYYGDCKLSGTVIYFEHLRYYTLKTP